MSAEKALEKWPPLGWPLWRDGEGLMHALSERQKPKGMVGEIEIITMCGMQWDGGEMIFRNEEPVTCVMCIGMESP